MCRSGNLVTLDGAEAFVGGRCLVVGRTVTGAILIAIVLSIAVVPASAKRGEPKRSSGTDPAAFTLTVYGHLFDTDLDDLAAKLENLADSSRTERLAVVASDGERTR